MVSRRRIRDAGHAPIIREGNAVRDNNLSGEQELGREREKWGTQQPFGAPGGKYPLAKRNVIGRFHA